jgi:hypothetical protein
MYMGRAQFTAQDFFKIATVSIDNYVFRLHYQYTVWIFVCAWILVLIRQYIGDPINCIANIDGNSTSMDFIDTYCWIHSTFTIPTNRPIHPGGHLGMSMALIMWLLK